MHVSLLALAPFYLYLLDVSESRFVARPAHLPQKPHELRSDGEVRLDVTVDVGKDEIWLNRSQMPLLFDRDVKTIGKHIANALKEELEDSPKPVVAKFATVQKEGDREVERQVEYYNLDVIISVGYRVKSQRGVEFRRWATDVLRRYIVEGRAENEKRLAQLAQVISVMERLPQEIGAAA